MNKELILRQKSIAREYMRSMDPNGEFSYHNWKHVENVIKAVEEIAIGSNCSDLQTENLVLAAIWHDADYANGAEGHEERSANIAAEELSKTNLSEGRIDDVKRIILATDMGFTPIMEDEKIIKDADLSHLASDDYMTSYIGLFDEINAKTDRNITKEEWKIECVDFMSKLKYHSTYGQETFSQGKNRNVQKIKEMESANQPVANDLSKAEKKALKKKRKKNKPKYNAEKGIETMFRVALRNHISLSQIADDKANTLISVNAIILSIVLSALFPKLDSNPWLLYPGLVLTLVSICTIIMSTLSTIPKTTHGSVSKIDVENKRGNLLFFGNFHKMSLEEYEWSIGELMKDGDYLYGSLTRDLYFLGKVLNRKYSLLRYAYMVFVLGLVISILLFVYSIVTLHPVPPINS